MRVIQKITYSKRIGLNKCLGLYAQFAMALAALYCANSHAASVNVNSDAALRAAITSVADGDTIAFTANITLAGDLPVVQKSITIDGGNFALDGSNLFRGFLIAAWTPGTATFIPVNVTIQNMTIQNANAKGGTAGHGAGGGAGLGGAIFVANLANVTVSNVTLSNNAATGGGSLASGNLGGGGGMGGNGGITAGNGSGGGGGLGSGANGGNGVSNGSSGIATGASSGGDGLSAGAGVGGADGGGGGGGAGGPGFAGGGGGVGGTVGAGTSSSSVGGSGGFGGGGGMGSGGMGGAGGFGGGGGTSFPGGVGGFGGGGGGAASGNGAAGGFGGGAGNNTGNPQGGGGAGMGGAIFVQQGGSLSFSGPLTVNGNTVTGATANGNGSTGGSAFGNGIFIQGNNTIAFSTASGATQTVSDVITDQTGNGGIGGNAGAGALTMNGAGTLVLGATNTYTGTTTVSAGTLLVSGSLAAASATTVASGATLAGTGTLNGDVTAQTGGIFAPGSGGIGTLGIGGAATWNGATDGSATALFDLSNSSTACDKLAIAGAFTKGTGTTFKFDFQNSGKVGATYILATFASTNFSAADFSAINLPAGTFPAFSIVAGELRLRVDSPPAATVLLNTPSAMTNDTLTATATKSDPENDPVTLTFVWKVNGSVKKTTTASAGLTDTFDLSIAGNGDKGDTITIEVTPNDGTANGNVATASASVANSAPSAGVTLNAVAPKTNDVLTATATKTDADGDQVTLTYVWKVNGSVKKTTAASAGLTDTFDLSIAGNGDTGDLITVEVTPNDGTASGSVATASASVANTAPGAGVTLNAAAPKTNDVLTATATKTDADGDLVTLTYVWKVNGSVKKTTAASAGLTDTFDLSIAGNGNKGDTITVEVTPNDGAVDGSVATASASVVNTAPGAGVTLNAAAPKTNDVLTATATKTDADGDLVTLSYVWKVNGSVKKTTAASAGLTDTFDLSIAGNGNKGDTITVEATPNDGTVDGSVATASASVANSAPGAGVTLNAAAPKTNDVLTATATKTDADGDLVTLTYVWKVNGSVKKTTAASAGLTDTFDLSIAGNGDKGDTITVEVTPNDGSVDGATATASATIVNSPPTIGSGPGATPNPAGVAQPVSFSITGADADGDMIAYTWNFGDGSTATGASISHAFMTASVFNVTVAVDDGHGGATQASVSVAIGSSTDINLLHGALKLNGANKDSATLLAILNLAPNELAAGGNAITIQIGGLSRQFNVNGTGKVSSGDAHLQLTTYKRFGKPVVRLLMIVSGSLKASLFAGLALDESGHPATIPVEIFINGHFTSAHYPLVFKRIGTGEKSKFGTK